MRTTLGLTLLFATGCATMRIYHTPLTAQEGVLAVPALVSTAESMGLKAYGQGNQVQVQLEDGTNLYWYPNGDAFLLNVILPSEVPEAERETRWRESKVRADQIWELALQARQQSNVGAAMIINPNPPPPPPQNNGMNVQVRAPGMSLQMSGATGGAPAPANISNFPGGCRSSLDCGSSQFCKDWRGTKVCMGDGKQGAPCDSGIDCGSGLFCRSGTCG